MWDAKRRLIAIAAFVVVLASAMILDLGSARLVLAQRAVSVPDVVGFSQARASAAIERAGLVVGDVRSTPDEAPKGIVVAQAPPAGTRVAGGSRVSYVISTGPSATPTATPKRSRSPTPTPTARLVVVPDVRGLTEAEAVARIRRADLAVSARQRGNNATIAAGRAVRTKPAAGASLPAGSGVVLLISRGPRLVVVPDLVGRLQGGARKAIVQADLVAGEVTSRASDEPKNTVLDQDPAAGTRVRPGAVVSFTVSAGPPTVVVPDVRGLSDADAMAAIEEAGLVVSRTATSPDASIEPGDATGTEPGSGAVVEVGSAVVLTLSAGIDVAADGGPPDGMLLVGLVTLIILAGIAGVGATKLARGQRATSESSAPLPSIRTVSHPDRLPKILDPRRPMSVENPTALSRRVPTVGGVLSSEPTRLAADLGAAFRDAAVRGDLGGGIRRLARPALEFAVVQLGSAAERLTGIELGGILLDGWRSHRDVIAAADRTVRSPGASEVVGLTAHQVSAAHEPTIDLIVDERLTAVFHLAIGVEIAVANLMATISTGRLVDVRVGETEVSVTLGAEGIELSRGSARVDLSRSFALGQGVVIRRESEGKR